MRSKTLFFIYILLIIIFPNGIGIDIGIDFRIWMFLAFIFLFLPFINYNMKNKAFFDSTNLAILFFVLLSTIRFFIFSGTISGIGMILKFFLYFFLAYFAGKYYIQDEKDLMKFFYVLSAAAIIESLMVFKEFYTGIGTFVNSKFMINPEDSWNNSQINWNRFGLYRGQASFVHPIYLGCYLFLITLCNMLILIYQRDKVKKFFKYLLTTQIILGVIAGIFSQSRTAILACILVSVLILIIDLKNIPMLRLIILLPLISLVVFLLMYYFYSDYFTTFLYTNFLADNANINWNYRINISVRTFENIFKYPSFFGEKLLYSSELRSFIKNDLTNGILNKFIHAGVFYGLFYIYMYFKALKKSYIYRKDSNWGLILFSIFMYYFVVDNLSGIA
ncbi:MAG: O-antigen ligase family protein, partial [Candidatus Hodarchaeota archaeon]